LEFSHDPDIAAELFLLEPANAETAGDGRDGRVI
jgi:hypothetical protein